MVPGPPPLPQRRPLPAGGAPDGRPAATPPPAPPQFSGLLASFKSQTDRGEIGPTESAGAPKGVHQNSVTCARQLPGRPLQFSTSGVDGKLVVWSADAASLSSQLAAVAL